MKEYAARYVSYDTAETWTGLLEFAAMTIATPDLPAAAITYDVWKAAVIKLYSGAKESTHYTVNELQQLSQDNFDNGTYTLGTFSTYYHEFQKISRWLILSGSTDHGGSVHWANPY